MTDRQEQTHNLDHLEASLKQVLTLAPTALGFFVCVIDEDMEAHTLYSGSDDAADVTLALTARYIADNQDANVFDKLLETQTKLMREHPDEFRTYAEKLQKQLEKE